MGDFCMPSLGADMKQGTLITWLVEPDEQIEYGQVIAEIETDKGLFEIEAFESGIVRKILVEERQRVPVGTVLAVIDSLDSAVEIPRSEKSMKTTAPS